MSRAGVSAVLKVRTFPHLFRVFLGLVLLGWSVPFGIGLSIGDAGVHPLLLWGCLSPFIVGGVVAGFWTNGIVLANREVTQWWGPHVPLWRRRLGVAGVSHVVVRETRRSHGSGPASYQLVLSLGGTDVLATGNVHRARRTAEQIGGALGIGVDDRTSLDGVPIVRATGQLDASLSARIKGEGELRDLPPKPDGRSVQRHEKGRVVIEVPRPKGWLFVRSMIQLMALAAGALGLAPLIGVFGGLVLAVPFGMVGELLFGSDAGVHAAYVAFGVVGVWVVVFPLIFVVTPQLVATFGAERLTLTARTLEVERRLFGFRRARCLSADDIEEVLIARRSLVGPSDQGQLVARGDAHHVAFGGGLSLEELRWIRDLVVRVLGSPQGGYR